MALNIQTKIVNVFRRVGLIKNTLKWNRFNFIELFRCPALCFKSIKVIFVCLGCQYGAFEWLWSNYTTIFCEAL